jgi:hypothetical protein
MRFFPYILRSMLRSKVRSVLTLLGLMVAVGIYCFLASIESSMNKSIDQTAQSTLLVVNQKDRW